MEGIECAYFLLFHMWAMLRVRDIKQVERSAVFALNGGHG